MRRTAFLLILPLASLSAAQDARPITYQVRAASAERVIAELSKVAGIPLETSPQTAREVLAISVKDVPLNTLMQKIASVTSAEWRPEGEGFRLVAATGIRNREANDELNERSTQLRSLLAERLKQQAASEKGSEANSSGATGAAVTSLMGFGGGTAPGDKAINQLLQGIDLSLIAALGSNERIVFSSIPTRMQRPLPSNTSKIVNAYIADHNRSVKGNAVDLSELPGMENIPSFVRQMAEQATKPIGTVERVHLIVSRMSIGIGDGFSVSLRLYDSTGKVAGTTSTMLQLNDRTAELMASVLGTPSTSTGKETEVVLSVESKELQKAFEGGVLGNAMMKRKISNQTKALLFRPDQFDPLAYVVTDSLFSLARKRGEPLVANVPDTMIDSLGLSMGSKPKSVEAFETELKKGLTGRLLSDPGWVIVKPARPASARNERVDRRALASLLQAVDRKGVPSLDDVAAYSLGAPSPLEPGLSQYYVTNFVPGAMSQSMDGITSWDAIRLYGSLAPNVRESLSNGGRLTFGMLNSFQQQLAYRLTYGAMAQFERAGDPPKGPDSIPFVLEMMGLVAGDLASESTEVAPNGIPGDAALTFRTNREPILSPAVGEGEMVGAGMGVLGIEELAMFRMFSQDPNLAMISSMLPTLDQVRIGERATIKMTLSLSPAIAVSQKLNDNRVPKDGPVIGFNNIPEEFQKRINLRMEELKKSPLGSIGSMMGGFGGGGRIKP